MKMTTKTRWRAGAALAAALAALAALVPGRAEAQRPDVAVVYRLLQEGRMVVEPLGAPGRPAALGERLRDRDLVTTSENTRAALRFTDDGSILRVNPKSSVRLTSGDERGVVVRTLQLEFGELWTRVTRREAGTALRVRTPAGVAAVKGTEFVVRVDSATGATTVLTLEGVVEFFNDAGRVDLPAGQKVVATSPAEAPRAEPATREELRGAEGARGDEGGTEEGTWVEVELQDNAGRTRTLMLRVPTAAVRARVEAP